MKSGKPDLNLLQSFDALMRERNVTRAADQLDISQSSMSVALARMRELFNDELLIRKGTVLVPTQFALMLHPKVQNALNAAQDALQARSTFEPATADDVFRMIIGDYIDILIVPQVMKRIADEAPNVRVHMLLPSPQHFQEMLATGEIDLAISYFPNLSGFLKSRRLFSDRFVAVAAKNHPAQGRELSVREFCDLEHITIEPNGTQVYNLMIDSALEEQGLRRNVRMIKPTFLTVPFLLESTRLVCCVPIRLAKRMAQMAKIELFDVPLDLPTFDVNLLWHPRTSNSAAHDWMRSLVAECARDT